jgi:hypothetical protein
LRGLSRSWPRHDPSRTAAPCWHQTIRVWATDALYRLSYTGVGITIDYAPPDGLRISKVEPGGSAAGRLEVGDVILAVAEENGEFVAFKGSTDPNCSRTIQGPAGSTVRLRVARGGKGRPVEIRLIRKQLSSELPRLDPLLSLFTDGQEWVAWTPEGYYAASPGGESLIGWQVDHGLTQPPDFYTARQFRDSLYRPDVIRKLFRTLDVGVALAEADKEAGILMKPGPIETVADAIPPKVRLIIPKRDDGPLRVVNHKVEIQAMIEVDRPADVTVKLLINGKEHEKAPEGLPGGKLLGKTSVTWLIPVDDGLHDVVVVAAGPKSWSADNGRLISGAPVVGRNKLFVLAVGVGAIPKDRGKTYPSLPNAPTSAGSLAKAFAENSAGAFKQGVEVVVLADDRGPDGQPTRGNVLDALDDLSRKMGPTDTLVFYFCGHGDVDAGRSFLMPSDADPVRKVRTALSAEDLGAAIRACKGTLVVLLDACYSGAVANQPIDLWTQPLAPEQSGVNLCGASLSTEKAWDKSPKAGRGAFAHFLIEGLEGKAPAVDGRITLPILMDYTKIEVQRYAKTKLGGQQLPWFRPAQVGRIDPEQIVLRVTGPRVPDR